MNKINITNYGHLKKNPNNVINDLYKLCFQDRVSLIILSSYKKERLKMLRSLLGVKGYGGGGGWKQPSLQHLVVMVKINIFMPNFS